MFYGVGICLLVVGFGWLVLLDGIASLLFWVVWGFAVDALLVLLFGYLVGCVC